jgi:hypothetical protein
MRAALLLLLCLALGVSLRAQPSIAAEQRVLIDSLVESQPSRIADGQLYTRLCRAPHTSGRQVVVGRIIPAEGSPAGTLVWVASAAGLSSTPDTTDRAGNFRLCDLVLFGQGGTLFGAMTHPDGRVHLTVQALGAATDPVLVRVVGIDPPAARTITSTGDTKLIGNVFSSRGSAIANATVSLDPPSRTRRTLSSDEGTFSLDLPTGIGEGGALLTVRALRHRPLQLRVSRAIASATIVLDHISTTLDTVRTRASRTDRLSGFDLRRAQRGGGTFITEEEIRQRQPQLVSQLLRGIPGLVVETQPNFVVPNVLISSMRQQGSSPEREKGCLMSIWVDGTRIGDAIAASGGLDLLDNVVTPGEIRGIEVHHGFTTIPPEFARPGKDHCGTIVVWTKRGS